MRKSEQEITQSTRSDLLARNVHSHRPPSATTMLPRHTRIADSMSRRLSERTCKAGKLAMRNPTTGQSHRARYTGAGERSPQLDMFMSSLDLARPRWLSHIAPPLLYLELRASSATVSGIAHCDMCLNLEFRWPWPHCTLLLLDYRCAHWPLTKQLTDRLV